MATTFVWVAVPPSPAIFPKSASLSRVSFLRSSVFDSFSSRPGFDSNRSVNATVHCAKRAPSISQNAFLGALAGLPA